MIYDRLDQIERYKGIHPRLYKALELLREMRTRLDEELGIEPGPALRDLELAVLRQDASVTGTARPTPQAKTAANELPLVGRATELRILAAVEDSLAG